MTTYTEPFTSEELFDKAANGDEQALWSLCKRYEPLFKCEAKIYLYKMADAYDTEDFLSFGYELIWELTKKQNFKGGSFGGYLKQATRNRFSNIFRNFAAKNMVCTRDTEDCRGEITRTYMIDESFQSYKEKQKVRNADWYRRNAERIDAERAEQGLPKIYRKSLATPEEKAEHDAAVRARAKESVRRYQAAHKEEHRLAMKIRNAKKAIENWTAKGNTKKAEEAKRRLEEAQAELRAKKA